MRYARRLTAMRLALSLAFSGCAAPAARIFLEPGRRIVAQSRVAAGAASEIASDPLVFGPYALAIEGHGDPLIVRGWVASEEDAVRVEARARRAAGVRRVEPQLAVRDSGAARR